MSAAGDLVGDILFGFREARRTVALVRMNRRSAERRDDLGLDDLWTGRLDWPPSGRAWTPRESTPSLAGGDPPVRARPEMLPKFEAPAPSPRPGA